MAGGQTYQWIGLRENLQGNRIWENLWFPVDVPLNQSIQIEKNCTLKEIEHTMKLENYSEYLDSRLVLDTMKF